MNANKEHKELTDAVNDMVAPKKKAKKKNSRIVMSPKKKTTKKKTQKKKVVKKKAAKKKAVKVENTQKTKKKVTGGKNYVKNGNPKGGKRKNSGRKKSTTTRRTREIANKLAESDEISPLEYMLGVLRETPEKLKEKYDAGDLSSEEFIVELQAMQKRKDNAAEKAAPYIHPRLSSIEAKVTDNAHERWLALMEGEK